MRQVAHHVWVKEILEGRYEEKEGWEPNLLHTGRGPVSRVNIIGTLLLSNEQTVLDDGTGQVPVRAFEAIPGLSQVEMGMMALIIGRPRMYKDRVFVIPEIIRAIDPVWAARRKQELGDVRPAPVIEEKVVAPQPVVSDNAAEVVVSVIAGLDTGDGADIDVVIEQSGLGARAEKIVNQLLLDGDIFEIRPGVIKVL